MELLTRTQKERFLKDKLAKDKKTLMRLRVLVKSKHRKDLLPDAKIELGKTDDDTLYLTYRGLRLKTLWVMRDPFESSFDKSGHSWSDTEPSIRLVEKFNLSENKLLKVLESLTAN